MQGMIRVKRNWKQRCRGVFNRLKLLARRLTAGWAPYREALVPAEDLAFQMRNNAIPSLGFFLMLGLSAIIAMLGLVGDSAPAIIGAMIIAPLMAPIISMAYGIASADRQLIILSTITIICGTLVVIAISYAGAEILRVRIAGSEILSRTSPSYIDLGVALAAGCAGAFAQTRMSIANSIAGVAIAVALVPPLAVTGIGLSVGAKVTTETGRSLNEIGIGAGGVDIASGSFLLFLTNLIGIVFVAALVFLVQRYGNWRKAIVLIAAIVVGSLVLMPSLHRALRQIYVENRVMRLHEMRMGHLMESDFLGGAVKIESIHVFYVDDLLHVSIDIFATRDNLANAQARVDELRDAIAEDIGEPVSLQVDMVPIERIRVVSEAEAIADDENADDEEETER